MFVGEMELEEAAKKLAGNWKQFNCFFWYRDRDLANPEEWALIYTHSRDSRLLARSNSAEIHANLEPFAEMEDADIVFENHMHWAVGDVEGFSIRVFRDGNITEAFEEYHRLAVRMSEYPVLNDTEYSNREYEATLSNIDEAAWKLKTRFILPEGWTSKVYEWLSEHRSEEIENRDDLGGHPTEKSLKTAFDSLGFVRIR